MAEERRGDEVMASTLQEMLLALLVFHDKSGGVVAGYLRAEHFDGVYRDIAEAALLYRRKFGRAPGRAHAEDALAARAGRAGNQRATRVLRALEARGGEVNPDYAVARAQEHVRRITLRTAIVEATDRYYGPSEGSVDDMESILYEALRARAEAGDAGTFLSDTTRSLAFLDRAEGATFYGLGIPVFDKIGVGMVPGRMLLYIAAKNTGKSWFCVHCGRQAVVQGARVAHIICEGGVGEEEVAQRYFQTFFGVATSDDKFPVSLLEFDELERLVGFKTRSRAPRASLGDPRIRSWFAKRIKPWGTRLGSLVIKRFPSGQLTLAQLRGYLDFLEAAHKFVPDVLIVDYPDLMQVDSRNFRVDLGRTFVGLCGVGVERRMAVVAPTQSNRSSLDAKWVDTTMVSEDKTKLDTADYVMTYSQTQLEQRRGLARLRLDYSRTSARGQVVVLTQSYPTGQYVLQSALQTGAYWDAVGDLPDEAGETWGARDKPRERRRIDERSPRPRRKSDEADKDD